MEKQNNFIEYTLTLAKQKEKIAFLSSDKLKILKQNLGLYFIQEKSELKQDDDFYTVFNYYYSGDNEIKIFGEFGKENNEIKFGKYKFKIEYLEDRECNDLKKIDPWKVLWN